MTRDYHITAGVSDCDHNIYQVDICGVRASFVGCNTSKYTINFLVGGESL